MRIVSRLNSCRLTNTADFRWAVFLLSWGGIFAVVLMQRVGRLPVLFWSQLLALGFLIGCALAPNLSTFAAMRFLTSVFCATPQVTGHMFWGNFWLKGPESTHGEGSTLATEHFFFLH